jgi:hypothetical protein
MSDELVNALARFHQQVFLPDIQRIVGTAVEDMGRQLRDEMHTLHDSVLAKLDKLETEYHSIKAGLGRVDERLDQIERRLERVEQRLDALGFKRDSTFSRSDFHSCDAAGRFVQLFPGRVARKMSARTLNPARPRCVLRSSGGG